MPDPASPIKILPLVVVDDERAFTSLLDDGLSVKLTCPVVAITSGTDALDFINLGPIGMLVTDFHMPRLNGIELVRMLADVQPGVPALIVTGHPLNAYQSKIKSLTALREVIQKPFGIQELADAILRHWLSSPGPSVRV